MPKPVTEDDLRAGVTALGGFSALTQAGSRDSPFGREYAKPEKSGQEAQREPAPASKPPTPLRRRSRSPSAVSRPQKASAPGAKVTGPKRDRYPVDVTVPMTAQMRSRARELAEQLQLRRSEKVERFTTNDVFRVLIEVGLERFPAQGMVDSVNTSEELKDLVRRRLGSGDQGCSE